MSIIQTLLAMVNKKGVTPLEGSGDHWQNAAMRMAKSLAKSVAKTVTLQSVLSTDALGSLRTWVKGISSPAQDPKKPSGGKSGKSR